MAAIFISHSSANRPEAEELAHWLHTEGLDSYFLDFDPDKGLTAGARWEDELYRRLHSSAAVVAVLTPEWLDSRWCFAEAALARSEGKPVFLVERKASDRSRAFPDTQYVDATGDPEAAMRLLSRSLREFGIAAGDSFAWDPARPVYPGAAFREEDAAVFFGREAETQAVLERLDALRKPGRPKSVLFIGASGSGKSSLVRAGVLPRLARPPRSGDWLPLAAFEPGDDPFSELAKRLARAFADCGETRDRRTLFEQRTAAHLLELVDDLRFSAKKEDATVVLTIDQTEQLLTSANASARDFLGLLADLSRQADRRLMVLATLRSDFLNLFQTDRALEGLVYETLPVAPMQQRLLPLVIEGPAKLGGFQIEPGLVQLMVQDSASGDALPLLAFTLRQMYERFARSGGALRVQDYQQMGGVEGAVRGVAEGALAAAKPDDRQLASLRKAFVPGLVDITEGGKYTGARVRWEDLPANAYPALEEFVSARLLIVDDDDGHRVVRIAHDALIASWPFLRELVDADRSFLEIRRRLEHAANLWERDDRDASRLLPRGRPLAEASDILASRRDDLTARLADFISRSEAKAFDELAEAKHQRDKAQANYLVAQAQMTAADNPALALRLAEAALRVGGAANAREIAIELYRRHLFRKTIARCEGVVALAFAAGDAGILAGAYTGELYLLDPKGGPPRTLWKAADRVRAIAVSRDGERIAVANGNSVQLLRPAGEPDGVLAGHQDAVTAVAFSPDSKTILTGSMDKTARLWDLSGQPVKTFNFGGTSSIWSVDFSPNGKYVLLGDTVQVFMRDLAGDDPMTFPILTSFVVKARWSPDGKSVVCNDSAVALLYDLSTGRPLKIQAEEGLIDDLAFSPHGGLIAATHPTGVVVFWDRSGKRVHMLRTGRKRGFSSMAFSHDGRYLAFAQDERVELAELWIEPLGEYADAPGASVQAGEVRTGADLVAHMHSESETGVHGLAASPVHNAFAAATGSDVTLWNLIGEKALTLTGHAGIVRAVAWSSDGQSILTGSEDKTARVWNLNGQPLAIVQHDSEVMTVAFDATGGTIATGTADGTVQLSTTSRVFMRAQTDHGMPIQKVAFTPSRELVAAAQGKWVRFWNYHARCEAEIEFADEVNDVVFGPGGQWLLARSWKAATIWRAEPGDGRISLFKKTTSAVDALAISPDGNWIAASGSDRFISVWNSAGEELCRIEHPFRCFSLAFTRDSRHLLAGLSTGKIEAWTVPAPIEEFLETGLVEALSAEQMQQYDIAAARAAALPSGT